MLDLTLAKQHLRVLHDEEDGLIASYLAAAKAWVEQFTGKLLSRREVTQVERSFASIVELYHGPEPESLTISYNNADGQPSIVSDARIEGQRVVPAAAWPNAQLLGAVRLTYTAGYREVPADLQAAVLLYVGHLYMNREAVVDRSMNEAPLGVVALCQPYRAVRI